MFNLDWLRVKKLRCLDCARRYGSEEATFHRDGSEKAFCVTSHLCPRCGGANTKPEFEVKIPDNQRRPPRAQP